MLLSLQIVLSLTLSYLLVSLIEMAKIYRTIWTLEEPQVMAYRNKLRINFYEHLNALFFCFQMGLCWPASVIQVAHDPEYGIDKAGMIAFLLWGFGPWILEALILFYFIH